MAEQPDFPANDPAEPAPVEPVQPAEPAPEPPGTPSDQFDPAVLEHAYGLPQGALNGAENAESATELIRAYVDRSLVEGLLSSQAAPQPADDPPADTPAKPVSQGTAVEQRVAALEAEIAANKQAQKAQAEEDLKRRLLARIDSWQSPKYGVGDQRKYRQVQATRELAKLVLAHHDATTKSGQPVPVELLADRVRLFDDEGFVPTVREKPEEALGTPGSGNSPAKKPDQPSNIYEAFWESN